MEQTSDRSDLQSLGAAAPGSSVSATERDSRAQRLAQHAVSGNMTLDEYVERAAALGRATTVQELDAAVVDLPGPATESNAPHRSWLFGIFGGTKQRGRWRLSRRLRVINVFGGTQLDLGAAAPESPECTILVVALLGGAEIIAPSGVPIFFSGVSLFGGRSDERHAGMPLPGAPTIRMRAFAVLGGVKVTESPATH